MSKIGLIIKREYLHRVEKKSFILLTFLMPFLFAALVFVPLWLSTIQGDEVKNIVLIDTTGKYAPLFQDVEGENYHFIHSDKSLDEYRNSQDKEIFAILNISDDLLKDPNAAVMYSEKQVSGELSRLVNRIITKELESEKLASFNIPNLENIIKESKIQFNVQTIKWSADGSESESSAMVASMIGSIFTIIIYMFIMMYGVMVMQGVMEEKTNRIIEVIISSVKPFELMIGKIVGIGLVGLTQIFIWGVMTFALLTGSSFLFGSGVENEMAQSALVTGNATAGMATGQGIASAGNELFSVLNTINFTEIGIYLVIYFIGGYLLYASMFAAIGSAVDSQDDTQQFVAPVTVFMVFALYAGIYSMENPDGPLAFWCSIIPFTSPIVMMVRIPFEIPLWEKLLSVVLLFITVAGFVWISAKIYRIGILMYGKKASIKEIIKWIKYK